MWAWHSRASSLCTHRFTSLRRKHILCTVAVSVQRDLQSKCSPSPSHWACAVLAPCLSSWKDLSLYVCHTLEVTTYTQSYTSINELLYITWTVICCKLVTVTDRAATRVGDRVRTACGWTRLLLTSHWTTLREKKHGTLSRRDWPAGRCTRMYVHVCVCCCYLTGAFSAEVSWVRDWLAIGKDCTVIETAC